MRNETLRVVVAVTLAAVGPAAGAHEFTCDRLAGIVALDASGAPVIAPGGLPSFAGGPSPVLTLRSYPALVGLELDLRNLANDTSVVTSVSDSLLAALGTPAATYGAVIGPGFSLPVGGSATEVSLIQVASQEECLRLFGGQAADAPVCTGVTDDRLVVGNDVGSTECRARVVCGGPAVAAGPPPPPACAPTWTGIKQFGQSSGDGAMAIGLGPDCAVSVAGYVSGGTFPNSTSAAFLETFDAAGAPRDVETWGQRTFANALAVDGGGNRWVAWTDDTGDWLSKFDAAGARLWDRRVWNGAQDGLIAANGVAADLAGNAYAVGSNRSETLAVVKLAPDGTPLWARTIAGLGIADGIGVAVDRQGEVLVAGPTILPNTNDSVSQALVAKLDADGDVLWTRIFAPEGGAAWAYAVAVDPAGDAFVGGWVSSVPVANNPAGQIDALVAKLDPEGNVLWTRQLASPLSEATLAVGADSAGDVWATGYTHGALPGATSHGGEDAFVAKLDPAGNLVALDQFGTPMDDEARAIAVDAEGDAFVAGATGGDLGGSAGGFDAFVAKFDPLGNVQ